MRCSDCLSLLNWIGALTLKLPPRTLEHWFPLWNFLLLRLLCISVNLPYGLACNNNVIIGLVLLAATLRCWINYKNRYVGLLSLTCSLSWIIGSSSKYRCSSELAPLVLPPYSQWGVLFILRDSMIFQSPLVDVIGMSMSTVSFLSQPDSRFLSLQNAFLWSVIQMALSLERIDTFYYWAPSKQLFCTLFIFFVFSCNPMPCSGSIQSLL